VTVGLRQAWKNADDARRRLIWQQWATTLVSGASVEEGVTEDADRPDAPMRWTLTFGADGLAARDGDGLVVARLLKPLAGSDLGAVPELAQLVTLPARRTPLRVLPYRETTRVALAAPPGFRWVATPPEIDVVDGPHHFRQRVRVEGARLVVERDIAVAPARVDPADYPAFRARMQEVVQAFEARARLAPGAP